MTDGDKTRDYLNQVTAKLRQARQRLREVRERDREPIAIIGMGCRYPGGVQDPEGLWEVLAGGRDVISGFPGDRGWDVASLYDPDPDRPGTSYARHGGFVHDVAGFDPGVFGISPREALAMDPQQRLLLEVAWEAVERAGIAPASLRGSLTGVFAGAAASGYGMDLAGGPAEGYLVTGTATSVVSGRVSYVLGLEGPAVTVDTACSSSLVALHLACQALRSGECTLALAGGVTVLATPGVFVWFSRQGGMSRDGRCRSFGAAADGSGWAEGAGMVVVERLSVARRNGHPVLAVIRGSALNQDGASNGMTAPNGPSQQRVIRAALANAGMSAAEIEAVEAHGSGTTLGDPIEAQALLATYGTGRPADRPLWLGSVKSNIGHTQAAAGVAGVIKMVLALRHGLLPRTLHADEPNPHVDWSAGAVRLLTEPMPWAAGDRPRRAGVSAFGISGTNAHIILEEPGVTGEDENTGTEPAGPRDEQAAVPVLAPGLTVWPVSGRTAAALAAQAGRLAAHVAACPDLDPADVGWSLAATRSVLEYRAVISGASRTELTGGLVAVAAGQPAAGVATGMVPASGAGRIASVFPGTGAQWVGMGKELAAVSPVFSARLAECGRALAPWVDWSLDQVLAGADGAPGLDRAQVVQPVLWAVMVSLAAVWQAAGITPDAVVGHSQGEVAAATVAGILSLEDAARVVAVRGRALSGLAVKGDGEAGGGMVSVVMPAEALRELLGRWGDRLSVAAVNGPSATVVSGDLAALGEFEAELSARHVLRWRIPETDYVAHSAAVRDLAGQLADGLAGVRPSAGQIPMFSTVHCRWLDGTEADAGYWYQNVRQTVRFADAVRALAADGYRVFIEASAHPVLTTAIGETIEDAGAEAAVITGTLDRDDAGAARLVSVLARVHVTGAAVDWAAVLGTGQRVDLPTYAFQRRRFWPEPVPAAQPPAVAAGPQAQTAGWRYRISWVPVPEPTPAMLAGTWLLVVPAKPRRDLAEGCARALATRGAHVVVVETAADELDRAALAARIGQALAGADGVAGVCGVLSLLAADEAPAEGHPAVPRGLAGTQALLQALADGGIVAPLWALTTGAVAALTGEALVSPVQAMVWGICRVAGLEQPDTWGGLVDMPAVLDEQAWARLCGVLAGCEEDQVAIRGEGVFARRLTRAALPGADATWVPSGTVLITGGTGAIAGHVARWLAGRGAPRVTLASRSGPGAAGAAALVAELAAAGTAADVIACDIADRTQVAGLLARIAVAASGGEPAAGGPPLTAVMHTAGVEQSTPIAETSLPELATVAAAKAAGAALLDELTQGLDLEQFVLFSSIAATWGSGAQPGYAAANAFLDALAEQRRCRGLAAASVAWGPWGGGGMTDPGSAARLARRGLDVMDPRLLVTALGQVLDGGETQVTIANVDWARFAPPFALRRPSPLIEVLPEVRQALADTAADRGPAAAAAGTALARQLAELPPAEQDRTLVRLVRSEAATVLGHSSPDPVEARRAFSDLGFDSLTAVELRNRLTTATGLRLPATLLFDFPSPVAVATFLRQRLSGTEQAATPGAGVTAAQVPMAEPVAIVAMSCRFPGGVRSPEDLWELVTAGRDVISGFPGDRGWDLAALRESGPDHPEAAPVTTAGFMHEVAGFDAGFFGISPREALAMDPQQRLVLETSWEALERAGIALRSAHGTATGVFVGAAPSGYGLDLEGEQAGHLMTGTAGSVLSGRVSYLLGLEGPAVTVDTACSSALVAMHLACQALRAGECDLALAGGVMVLVTPGVFMSFSRALGLAADGRCKAFSAQADGMGMSEGAGMVLLERLPDARRNGHPVLAVVAGSAVNQDGASNGLTAPNGPSQQRVIRAALASAGLCASDVDSVEAHGTGTVLGDPIEAQAVIATYGQDRPAGRPLWLGSVKSNIGHPQQAAGMAGVIKMVLALRHGVLPATLHVAEPSPHVDWSAGDVRLLTEAMPWTETGRPRRAGVSAFGMSGTNVHAILEQAPADPAGERATPAAPLVSGAVVWVVSARSAAGLAAQASRLAAHVTARPELDAADVGWSLATSRSMFEHRAVLVGAGRGELMAGVQRLAAGQPAAVVSSGLVAAGVTADLGKTVFVFPGQGAQWAGMGRELMGCCPVFAARLTECSRALAPWVGWSLDEVLAGAPGAPGLDRAEVVQPVLWAVMVSLAAVWQAAGVRPDAVVGHSQGEIAAATVAGALSLEDAAQVVAVRSRALSGLGAEGGMVSVVMPEGRVRELMERWGERLSVAAVNGPAAVVVSGDLAALGEFEAELAARHVMRWRVPETDFVAHSARVEGLAGLLADGLASISPAAGQVPLYSTALSRWMDGTGLNAGYWYDNVRQTVRFVDAVRDLAADGYRVFIEVSPHPTLEGPVADTIEDAGLDGRPVISGTLHQESSGAAQILSVMARVFARGVPVDWAAVSGGGRLVDLPTYAFQRERYWPKGQQPLAAAGGDGAGIAAEARFWAAVEGGDLETLSQALAIDGRQPLHEVLPALAKWRRRELDRSVTEGWRYRVDWAPVSDPDRTVLAGTWLVVAPGGAPGEPASWCERALAAAGAQVITVHCDAGIDRAVLAERVGQALAGAVEPSGLAGVVSLLALDQAPAAGHPAVPAGLAATLALIQALGDTGVQAPLWMLTRGAVATRAGEGLASPLQAQAWGLGRAARNEYPDRWGGLIDLPSDLDQRAGARLWAVLAARSGDRGEDEVAIRAAGTFARRLVRAPLPAGLAAADETAAWEPRGAVLITGGTGAVGGHVARWLAGRGAPRLVLTSRSGPGAPGVAARAAELAAAGTTAEVVTCDTADREGLAGLLAHVAAGGPPLTAVMHTAGVLDDGVLDGLDTDRLATTLTGKAAGAMYLDELTAGMDLDAFVLFSSAASTFGGAGQGNYAAANAYLDALAQHRASRGIAGLSVAWGPWAGGGVAESSEAVRQRLRRGPLPAMDPVLAIKALGQALAGQDSLLAVMDVDWSQFAVAPAPFVRDLPDVTELAKDLAGDPGAGAGQPLADGELARRLAGLPSADQVREATDFVRSVAAEVLGHTSAAVVAADRAFSELGLDSLTSLEMRQHLNTLTGLRLPATLLFDYPTPAALGEYLRAELVGDLAADEAVPSPAVPVTAGPAMDQDAGPEPVAIVSMSCRFPGGVSSPEDMWDLLAGGVDAISAFPRNRNWDLDGIYDPDPEHEGTSYVRGGGFVHDATDFDPGFFSISPREALAMDPQQRLLLEACWEVLERAGLDPGSLRGSQTGVFVGAAYGAYDAILEMALQGTGGLEGHLMTGNATSVLSGRISYVLGLEGPAVTVDTACSSALVTLHMACQALRARECDLALAGGVTVMATPFDLVSFSRQRKGLAADGRCRAFSAAAEGMGLSEGVGMIAVERLADARRHGHPVLALVAGSAINQDGASNGLTAPNGRSQQRVIRAALASAGLSAADVDAVEAHGTGTELGDPIEAQALLATYGQGRPTDRPLWLGSVKSNMGHTQAAAGAAGVIKLVLALRNGMLPRTLHAEEPSPHIDWSSGAVRLLTEPVDWPAAGRPRRAGVSAFGISGTNAHLILEEAPAAPDPAPAPDPVPAQVVSARVVPWTVSARTAAGLAAQAAQLAAHVVTRPELDPTDVGWSLAATRSVFEHRGVVTGGSRAEMLAGLAAVAAGQPAGGVVTGAVPPGGAGRIVFVFPGQGTQWAGMGRELAAQSPVFAARLAECGQALACYVDWSLDDVLAGAPGAPSLDAAEIMQPALWAVLVSLAAVWQAAGITPDAVLGHSQGEIAAATVAGMLSLDDAARVVALRSRALSGLGRKGGGEAGGGMVSVVMPEPAVRELLARWADRLAVAAVNGPAATVVSGDPEALAEFEAELSARHILRWPIPVSDFVAHSPRVDELAGLLAEELASLRPEAGRIRLFSTVSCRWTDGTELDAGYWYDNVRQTVRFADAVRALAGEGYWMFIEVSPHPVLTAAVTETIKDADPDAEIAVTGTLEREDAGARRLLSALAQVHVRGPKVNWAAVLGAGRRVDLPTYAFQRQRIWPEPVQVTAGDGMMAGGDGAGTEAEARFWAAVEGADLQALSEALAVEDRERLGAVLPALTSWRRRERDKSATSGWRYKIAWVPVPEPAPAVLTGTWLLVAPAGLAGSAEPAGGDLAAACARALAAHGAEVVLVTASAADDRVTLAARLGEHAAVSGVVSLLALDQAPLAACPVVPAGLALSQALVQAMDDAGASAPLWALTRGAVATGDSEVLTSPLQAMVWGLGRVAGLELPERWGGLVDVPAALDERAAARLCALLAAGREDQVAIRAAGVLARRLIRAEPPRDTVPWVPGGTVLITGGTGAVAGHVARWLAGRGAPRVVLASRSGATSPRAAAIVAELAGMGTAAEAVACDVSDRAQAAALVARIGAGGPRLAAVMHTAGLVLGTPLAEMTIPELAAMTAAKAVGAAHLHELTAGSGLEQFVLFSSIAATWGSGLQAGYSAANAFLDALAEHRRGHGLAGTSVAWGPWGGGGMTDHEGADQLARRGLEVMDARVLTGALGQAVDAGETLLTVANMDWALFTRPFTLRRPSPLIEDLPEVRQALADAAADNGGPAAPGAGDELRRQLASLPAAEQDRVLTGLVRSEAAAVLRHPSPDAVEPSRAFSEFGFDSLTAVELRDRLSAGTGLRLPATLLFDYPSPAVVATFLRSELAGELTGETAAPGLPAVHTVDEPVAIVGMSCRFPGGVRDPEELWRLVASGTDAVTTFPADRGWELAAMYAPEPGFPGKAEALQGGFVTDVAGFDPVFFGISPREALAMDPQQRLLLEVCWEAFERAGVDPLALRGSRTGIFAGATNSGYAFLAEEAGDAEVYLMTGNAGSVITGRVAYALGLEGPAVTIDTACSSALVALHMACGALRAGECDLALAGGVMVMVSPGVFDEFHAMRGLSSDGRCKAFSSRADGMGAGEGVGVILVERLGDARRNGHPVLAVVAGSAINQDGASNGLTAPNGPSQQRVIQAALASAGVSAADVDAVEAHGTGTELGDPIEAQALLATYGQGRPDGRPLWLGSVKSNIGHTQAAAGAAGVIKMVLALRHGVLPPTLHAAEPSPHVDWSAGDVRLLTEPVPWPGDGGRPRRAGVSSFGISGTNAHVILAEPPAPDSDLEGDASEVPVLTSGPVAWPVSGRSADGLRGQAERLAAHVAARPDLDPADVGWSLVTTRSLFEYRAVVTGRERGELVAGLRALAAREPAAGVVAGSVPAAGGGRVGFVFAGQGSQRAGMGAELYAASPVFAAVFGQACELLEAELGVPVREVVLGGGEDPRADQTVFAQAGLFAMQAGLVALLARCGIAPAAVAGHSVGEVAAAYTAGVLSLEDACALVAARARLMQELPGGGAMTAVAAGEAAVTEALAGVAGVCIAAVNGPSSVVISGDADAVRAVAEGFAARGMRVKPLRVSHAFHSHRMDPVLTGLGTVAARLRFAPPRVPWACALTGELLDLCDAGYWVRQAREPVRYADALGTVAGQEISVFAEIGPDGTLSALGPAILDDSAGPGTAGPAFIPLQRPGQPGPDSVLAALARIHVAGPAADWAAVAGGGRLADLPTYAFQHDRYWPQGAAAAGDARSAVGRLTAPSTSPDGLLAVEWAPLVTHGEDNKPAAGRWAVIGGGLPDLTEELAAAGVQVLAYRDLAGLAGPAGADGPLPDVVLAGAGAGAGDDAGDGATASVAEVLGLLQQWVDLEPLAAARLVIVTHGAVAAVAREGVADLAGAAVWGLVRVAQSEHPGRLVLADLPPGDAIGMGAGDRAAVLAAAVECGEPEVAIRGQTVYGRRLARPDAGGLPVPDDRAPWRLEVTGPGTLADIGLVSCPQAGGPLAAGQVRVAVRAAGVNFRDVVIGLGMHPGDAELGSEIAGVVAETGPGVAGISAGDRVLCLALKGDGEAGGGFGPLAVTDARLLAPVPAGWSFAQAAAVPMAFATAWHALADLAEARAGQKILVHAAAGGVGMAAVTIARHLGLDVYATASPDKHHVLAAMGLDEAHVASSRSGQFEQRFLAATEGRGMDIVLNSLAGKLTDAGLRLLPSGGVFIELGQADQRDVAGIATDYPAVTYRALDLSRVDPDRLGQILAQATRLLASGELAMPPVRAWDVRRADEALRFMSQARHVGKLVLVIPPDPATRQPGTALITGGTGMLGGLMAMHLAATERTGHVVLTSRSGPAAAGVPRLAADLAGAGAGVRVAACDVTDRDALAAVLAGIPAAHPLTMVAHTAGVIDDGTIGTLTPEQVEAVMRPKAEAAWHLHQLTQDADLEAFVLFSSISAATGGGGQGNYAAANAFLDGLASYRRSRGLPAVSLAWGMWAGGGMAGRLGEGLRAKITRGGMAALTAEKGLALLDAALNRDEALLVAALLDVAGMRAQAAGGMPVPPLWRVLAGGPARPMAAVSRPEESLRQRLDGMPQAGQAAIVLELVVAQAASVLGFGSPAQVHTDREFRDLGFDSLTAIELRNELAAATGLRLPATLVFDYPTPGALARYLRAEIVQDSDGTALPVLAELDKLESLISAVTAEQRARVTARLEALLAKSKLAQGQVNGSTADPDLGDATADELFELIDSEFGKQPR